MNSSKSEERTYEKHEPGVSQKSRMEALLLTIFLGEFGIQHFYVGRIWLGVIYLLTFGCFFIGWIVDIVLILAGKFTDNNGDYVLNWNI